MFYTYLYLREDGTPYYVGKGKDRRAFRRHVWVSVPTDRTRILLQEFPSEADAMDAERFLISFYGREDRGEGNLLNHTDGGEGMSGNNTSGLGHRRKGTGIFLPGIAAKGGRTQGRINAQTGGMSKAGKVGGRSQSPKKKLACLKNLAVAWKTAMHVRWHVSRGIKNPKCIVCVEQE